MRRVLVVTVAVLAALTSAAPTGAATNKADMTRARAALLRTGDVPSGFTRKPGDTSNEDQAFSSDNPDCRQYSSLLKVAKKTRTGKAAVEFHGTTQEEIDENTDLWRSSAPLKAQLAAFSSPAMGRCLEAELTRTIEQGIDDPSVALNVDVARSTVPKVGDQRGGWDVNISFAVGDVEQHLLASFVAVRVGRGVALLSFETQGTLVDKRDQVVRTAAKRLRAAVS